MNQKTSSTPEATTAVSSPEIADLLESLQRHRQFLRFTVQNLTDEAARSHPVESSELSLGGLIKHVTAGEAQWMDFAVNGPSAMNSQSMNFDDPDFDWNNADLAKWADAFTMQEHETLEGILSAYADRATLTDATLQNTDLNTAHELPKAPWFEAGKTWTVRRVVLHLIAETSQHAGHADILREAIDGQKTMG